MVWLVVGLGNPGTEYQATRHNIGAMVAEQLASSNSAKWSGHKSRTDIASFKIGPNNSESIVVARSHSYMNETGGPISALATFYKVDPAQIIAIHDELDLPFAALRCKFSGGDNGHNGLKSMTSAFGSDYLRLRMGIGRPPHEQQDPGDFVLRPFSSAEKKELPDFISEGVAAIESLILRGLELTQQDFND